MSEEMMYNGASTFYSENWSEEKIRTIKAFINIDDVDGLPLRIGISGAQGVGKTALANKLAKSLDIPCIQSVPRTVKGLGFKLNKSSTIESQMAIWLAQLNEQLNHIHFVSDRTIIDHVAYMTYLDRHNDLGMEKFLIRAMANITSSIAYEQYTLVFYAPISEPLVVNGVRSTDKKYQIEMDQIILTLLESFGIDYIPLSGSPDKQYLTAMSFISNSGLLNSLLDFPDE